MNIIDAKNISFAYRVLNKQHSSLKTLFRDFLHGRVSIENYLALDDLTFKVKKGQTVAIIGKTFEEVAGYDDIVLLKDMRFESHCEHHMVPIIGVAHIAYIPDQKVVGISKIARLLEVFAKRLQTQETMTAQIADTINFALKPKGVAVLIDAKHQCMTTRGIHNISTCTITKRMLGQFQKDSNLEDRFLNLIANKINY